MDSRFRGNDRKEGNGGGGGNRTRVLRGATKSIYMLISPFVFSPLSGSDERDPEEVSLYLSYFTSTSEEVKPACLPSPSISHRQDMWTCPLIN